MPADQPRPQFFRISHRSMFRRQGLTGLLLILLAVTMALPSLLYTTVTGYLAAALNSKLDTYGSFTDIFYEAGLFADSAWDWDSSIQKQLDGFFYQEKGLILSFAQPEKTTDLVLGYVDESSRNLGRIRLLEGAWPETADELVLVASARAKFTESIPDLSLGSTIRLAGKSWRISGFAHDFARLWSKGPQQITAGYSPPQILFSKPAFKKMLQEDPQQSVWRTTLFVREPDLDLAFPIPEGQFFYNANIQLADENRAYSVPELYFLVLYLAVFVVQMLFFGLVRQERTSVHRILQLLGMSRKRSRLLLAYELFLLLGLAFFLSLPAALGLGWLAHRLLTKLGSISYVFQVDLRLLLTWSGSLVLSGFLAILCSSRWSPGLKKPLKKIQTRQLLSGKSLFLWDLRLSFSHIGAMLAVILSCAGLFSLNADYNARYQAKNPSQVNLSSQYLPLDYDYELRVDGTRMGNTQNLTEDAVYQVGQQLADPVTFFTDQYGFGANQDFLDRLAAIEGMGSVRPYRQIDQVYLAVKNPTDKWLDGLDGSFDGVINQDMPLFYQADDARDHQLPELTVPVRLSGYPEKELLELAGHAAEGEIELEAVRQGKAAILIVPDYILESTTTKTGSFYSHHYPDQKDENAVSYQEQAVGDQMDIYGLFCNEKVWGQVGRENFSDLMRFFHQSIRIAAIIRQPAGGFDTAYGPHKQITIAMLNESFLALDLPANYVRIRANLAQGSDAAAVDIAIQNLAGENPVMPLKNLRLQMSDYRVYALFLRYFLGLLNGILLFIALLVLFSLSSNHLAARQREYILLRLNGLSLRRFGLIWAGQAGLALLGSFLLFFTGILLKNIIYLLPALLEQDVGSFHLHEQRITMQTLLVQQHLLGLQWFYPWLVMAACLLVLILFSVSKLRSFSLNPTAR